MFLIFFYIFIIAILQLFIDVSKDPLLQALRKELYIENYDTIDWDGHRQVCAEIDNYSPLNPVMKIAQDMLAIYEHYLPSIPPLKYIRNKALDFVISYIHAEDTQTNYVDIGPVNKSLNMLAVWIDGKCDNKNQDFLNHLPRIDDYLWVAEDGMKMQVCAYVYYMYVHSYVCQMYVHMYVICMSYICIHLTFICIFHMFFLRIYNRHTNIVTLLLPYPTATPLTTITPSTTTSITPLSTTSTTTTPPPTSTTTANRDITDLSAGTLASQYRQ